MLLRAVFSPHCSSPSTPTTAYLKTPLSSSWSLQTTPHWLASCSAYKQEAKELAVWCSLNNLELNTLKTVEMIVNFRRSSSPLPGEEVQPATGAAETVLLCHHWICPLHFNTCLVQLSNQIWPQKTNEGSPDCWTNHWYNPPSLTRTVLIQIEQKCWQNHSGPSHPANSFLELLPSGQCYRALITRTARHRNSSFPQAIHLMNIWTLNNKHETHNTIILLFS